MTGTDTTEETALAETALGLDTDLHHEFEQRGLSLRATIDTPDLSGPFSTVSFAAEDPANPAPQVAVAVIANDDLDPFDRAVDGVAAGRPELAASTPVSMATIEEFTADLPEPVAFMIVLSEGEPIGLIAHHVDRRSGGGSNPGGSQPAPEDLATQASSSQTAPADAAPSGTASVAENPAAASAITPIDNSLELLQDVLLEVSVELGRSAVPLSRLMNLGVGSIVELDRAAGAPVDIRVNGTLFAHGEVVVVDNEYAVRIIDILAQNK